jgi:ParB-like chromosome segregation protein Spo0J
VVRRSSNEVIAGNHQLEAARRLGWTHIAVVWTDDDDLTASAYALADNHVGELGEYDPDALATMLAEVAGDAELLAATAYTDADLDELLHRLDGPAEAQRGDAEVRQLDPVWGVIVSCENEAQQVDLLRRLTEEGHTVRALIS